MLRFDRQVKLEFVGIAIEPITDLRVRFMVESNDGQQFNHAVLEIFNMKRTSREAIARPVPLDDGLRYQVLDESKKIRVTAGYKDDIAHIFGGNILWAYNNRMGADWITHVELYTQYGEAMTSQTTVSFVKPTSAKTILERIVQPLSLKLSYTDEAKILLNGKDKTVADFSDFGLAYEMANSFLDRYGLRFAIEDENTGLVYNPRRPRDPQASKTTNNTFSPVLGLVGTPKITKSGIELTSLMRPHMKLHQRFFVESETTRGSLRLANYAPDYTVIGLRHVGDNRGDEWFTEVEGTYTNIVDQVF